MQKIIAVYVGAQGIAIISQFQNFIAMSTSFASGGINKGVTKYVSEFKSKSTSVNPYLSTSLKLSVFISVGVGIGIILLSKILSDRLFETDYYRFHIMLFGISIIFYALNNLLIAILNAYNQVNIYVKSSIFRSVFSLALTAILALALKLDGAIIAIALTHIFQFLITLFFLIRCEWFKWKNFKERFDRGIALKLLGFSLFALANFTLLPYVEILVRTYITDNHSLGEAGLWDGMKKISQGYFSIVTVSLSFYFLPKFSSTIDSKKLINEFFGGLKILIPLFLMMLLIIFILQDWVILLLYSPDFLEMKSFFPAFIIGDFFRLMIGYLNVFLTAKAQLKSLILLQVCFSIINYFLATEFLDFFGLVGLSYAHLFRTFVRLSISAVIVWFVFNKIKNG